MFVFIVGRFCETLPRPASDTDALQHLSHGLSIYRWSPMVKQERGPVIKMVVAEKPKAPANTEMRTNASSRPNCLALLKQCKVLLKKFCAVGRDTFHSQRLRSVLNR